MFDPTQVPRCLALSPDVFESFLVADRIHGMPETVMLKGHQLAITRKIAKRLMFQRHGVQLCQIVKYARLEHEKSAIDPGLLRVRTFSVKADDPGCRLAPGCRSVPAAALPSPWRAYHGRGGSAGAFARSTSATPSP